MPGSTSSAKPTKSQMLDDLIMGTNSSSITSKRSVERLYYPNEPHFFRYFVKKFQRRAPLINRGYWLRLRAIDVIVSQFLSRPSSKRKKVVINLGCGSDVLPWQCHTRYPIACENALFIDVDYPDLMRKKRTVVLETPQLSEILGPEPFVSSSTSEPILLRSDKYCQLACDLRELKTLRQSLETLFDLEQCAVLFVAEVSITYMDTTSADSLIQWASSIGQAEFCLLEQILPHGPDHPFAQTMLSHFNKLSTPPKSVGSYPTVSSQRDRFQARGWVDVQIWDLWDAWSSEYFVTTPERAALDQVEPFDEWEEFMLFARHYFVIHASAHHTGRDNTESNPSPSNHNSRALAKLTTQSTPANVKRRFGSAMLMSNVIGEQLIVHALGMGNTSRADSCDVFSLGPQQVPHELPLRGPSARMCFSLTDLGQLGVLLAGGRGSPTVALSDCWLFTRGTRPSWQTTWSLPVPLFRHSTIRLRQSSLLLVVGGKTGPSHISPDHFVFHPERGWLRCEVEGLRPQNTFGAVLCNFPEKRTTPGRFRGLLSGGIDQSGLLCRQKYLWDLNMMGPEPVIIFKKILSFSPDDSDLSLFGSQVAENGSHIAICGGMGDDPSIQGQDIIFMIPSDNEKGYRTIRTTTRNENPVNQPFMIGASAVAADDRLVVVGGGATCFSMGTFWQTEAYNIEIPNFGDFEPIQEPKPLAKAVTYQITHKFVVKEEQEDPETPSAVVKASIADIPRVKLNSEDQFLEVLRRRQPVILEDLQLGDCKQKWTSDYMTQQVGSEKKVVVHECLEDTNRMDFNSKNFHYITEAFGHVMQRMQDGDRLYLRSLSQSQPSEMPASLEDDFPTLAGEFCLPPELKHVRDNKFSSILRVSGRVNMWLHYDVMANVYAQIQGSKRMILFPPTDVTKLSFAPGASSSSLNVFASLESPLLAATHPHEARLFPGDVLLLPPMWLHTASPETAMSIAVNVFFRDLDEGYSTGRDVYGNRDLAAYEKGRLDVARIVKAFHGLPIEIREFYLKRLGSELANCARRD